MMTSSLARMSWFLYDKSPGHPSERQASGVQSAGSESPNRSLKPCSDM